MVLAGRPGKRHPAPGPQLPGHHQHRSPGLPQRLFCPADAARREHRPGVPERGGGLAALEYAQGEEIGLSKFVSVGNKADLNENDFLAYLKDDPLTDVIMFYLEDLTDPKRFFQLAREITGESGNKKPILAIKSGRTAAGARAASSHTGALAGSDEAYDALFAQCGVLRVESLEELFDYALAFSTQPLPRGNRVAIVTNAGGLGIMTTDAAVRYGLEIAEFEAETVARLKAGLPAAANIHNPVDVLGDAREDRYRTAWRVSWGMPTSTGSSSSPPRNS